jgi:hypothetical protein
MAMPERTFRVGILNASSSLNLVQTFNHLCGGEWTGGWAPPASIASGSAGELQSESDGFMTGTEGYVKYDVVGPTGRQGMIYVYWDNPYYGNTHFRFATNEDDVYPDCDYTIQAGSSTFGEGGTLPFVLNFSEFKAGTEEGGQITSVGDLVNWVVGPATLLGLVGIDDHPELDLELDDASSGAPPESFGTTSLGPVTLQLLTKATMAQWVGDWEDGNVMVNITDSAGHLTATIYDGSTTPPLSFTDTFVPGPGSLIGPGSAVIQNLLNAHSLTPDQLASFSQAAKTVIKQVIMKPQKASTARKSFESLVEAQPHGLRPGTSTVSKAIGALLQPQGGVAYLNNHVALTLYGAMQGGKQIYEQLEYQRLNLIGRPITSVMLGLNQIVS